MVVEREDQECYSSQQHSQSGKSWNSAGLDSQLEKRSNTPMVAEREGSGKLLLIIFPIQRKNTPLVLWGISKSRERIMVCGICLN